uniref:Uncharacterized protein n=1 Tax=Anguilla anguilla TaxID=7936 RepID=A0A0E9U5U0_ANGAN
MRILYRLLRCTAVAHCLKCEENLTKKQECTLQLI